MLFHTLLNIQCGNDEVPSFGLTDDPKTSYIVIKRNYKILESTFKNPYSYGYIEEWPLTDEVKEEKLRYWKSMPDYVREQVS